MAIVYPLIMPTAVVNIASIVMRARTVVGMTQSPFSGVQQVQKWPAQWWEADITLPPLQRAAADQWEAFLLSLNGAYGRFLLGDPERATPRGALGGTPLVKGSSQTGQSLDIYGCTPNVTGWMKAGDYFGIGSGASARMYRNLVDVDTDASGLASLACFPNLRSSPAGDTPIVTNSVQGVFRLATNQNDFSRTPIFTSISFKATEAQDGT